MDRRLAHGATLEQRRRQPTAHRVAGGRGAGHRLHQVARGRGAGLSLRARRARALGARARRAHPPVSRRLSARGAARNRALAVLGRAARRDLHQRARARDRRGRPRRRDPDRRTAHPGERVAAGRTCGTPGRGVAGGAGGVQRHGGSVPHAAPRLLLRTLAGGRGDRSRESLRAGAAARVCVVRAAARSEDAQRFGPQTAQVLAALEASGRRAPSTGTPTGRRATFPRPR